MSGQRRVWLYLRSPAEGFHSIERVFGAVVANLPADIESEIVSLAVPARGLGGRIRAILQVLTRDPGVHHVTGDVHFLVLALPWRRTVLTVHDLVHLRELGGFRRWLYRFLWFSLPLRLAVTVTVISDHTAEELVREFPYVVAKLRVVPNPLPAGLGPVVRNRIANAAPVILHVGTKENKNLDVSINVAKRLGAQLRILGRLHHSQQVALDASGVSFKVEHNVPDKGLAAIYQAVDVLLFASFAEGFGMPIIEAQACGIPVVTSDLEPMRSVSGGAALLIDPRDVDAAEAAVRRILEDDCLRGRLRREGFLNAERYSAKVVAERYAEVYRAILVNGR